MKRSELRNIIKEEISSLNESKSLQLTPEEASKLQNEEMGQPDFFMIEGFNA